MIMAAAALPKAATLDEVRIGLAGNLCRCTGYKGIVQGGEEGAGLKAKARGFRTQGSRLRAQGSGTDEKGGTMRTAMSPLGWSSRGR